MRIETGTWADESRRTGLRRPAINSVLEAKNASNHRIAASSKIGDGHRTWRLNLRGDARKAASRTADSRTEAVIRTRRMSIATASGLATLRAGRTSITMSIVRGNTAGLRAGSDEAMFFGLGEETGSVSGLADSISASRRMISTMWAIGSGTGTRS